MQVVIRSDPLNKMNEYMETFEYLSARTSCVRKLATFCGFLQGACA